MHGIAYGLAIDMASACDIRYASSDVKFSIKVGLIQFCAGLLLILVGSRYWTGC
jgi:enoyl-CoA hydratase/carnithine racemase